MKKLISVHIFTNGMVACFGADGTQLAPLQGRWNDRKEKILKQADNFTMFFINDNWNTIGSISKDAAARVSIEVAE